MQLPSSGETEETERYLAAMGPAVALSQTVVRLLKSSFDRVRRSACRMGPA